MSGRTIGRCAGRKSAGVAPFGALRRSRPQHGDLGHGESACRSIALLRASSSALTASVSAISSLSAQQVIAANAIRFAAC
jgi:hypothetical protein